MELEKILLGGLSSSAKAYSVAQLILQGPRRSYLYIAPTGRDALRFQKDVEFFLGHLGVGAASFFPPYDVLPFSKLSPHNDLICQRLKVLYSLTLPSSPNFLSTPVTAMLSLLPPKTLFEKPLFLKKNTEWNRDELLRILQDWGYQRVPVVIDKGNFAVRGGILDIFSPLLSNPVRIEWEGDEITSLRTFEVQTQKSIQDCAEAILIPVREIPLEEKTIATFTEKIRRRAEEKDWTKNQWYPSLEKVKEKISFSGSETYLPFFFHTTTTLWDWLPSDTICLFEDIPLLKTAAEDWLQEIRHLHQESDLLDIGEIVFSPEELENKLKGSSLLQLSVETHEDIRRELTQCRRTTEPLSPLTHRLKEWLNTDSVFLVVHSKTQANRLADLLSPHLEQSIKFLEEGFQPTTLSSLDKGKLYLVVGDLSQGFRLAPQQLTFITEEEIFGQKIRRSDKISGKQMDFTSIASLQLNDPIVHRDHGIGLYKGLIQMKVDEAENDFLILEYKDGDKLYLPVYRMNTIQKYVGTDQTVPRIDKMGGTYWVKIRGKSEKAIKEMAGELINLYATRKQGRGFTFSPPNESFETFEARFPYEETPDQENAILDVLQDMQKPEPMDRLILGDVGYGKTEVALRATFKAILDGRQVAILVPTTVLAFQHYERFKERFQDEPVALEMLSRFRSPAEQKKILVDLAQGKIDLVIGTHRLLQPDISFKNLGLLVIDEEHRFGVSHKEKIKRLRKNVDVLALSATPIPRTLHMSLIGLRPISVIESPPADRLSIRTFVMPFEESVIREAMLRELKRGGQIFFVYNEIASMPAMKDRLKKLVPEAHIESAHGQMEEDHLEDLMIRFFHQDFNVLLCTTIIESGLDVPTANTIIIYEADHMGLAQIYQLRGRVGRGAHRAYAYLLLSDRTTLSKEASQRMSVLQKFSELGSGYQMALYDLEIRGAGNLLGSQQSGHMAAIGYELYTELLQHAISQLKGEEMLDPIDPELHFPISAYLPEAYITDPPVRLELYRRMASLNSERDLDQMIEEIQDRFGLPPPVVENFFELCLIKIYSKKLRIRQIRHDGKRANFLFDPSSPLKVEFLTELIKKEKHAKLTPNFRLSLNKPPAKKEILLQETRKFLQQLALHVEAA